MKCALCGAEWKTEGELGGQRHAERRCPLNGIALYRPQVEAINEAIEQAKKEAKPRAKRLFEITCTVCLRVVEVNGWMKRSAYPICDRPECQKEHRRMINNMNKRAKAEQQANKRKYTGGTRR